MPLTRTDLINEIKTDLGHPTVRVDLDDSVYDVIINKSMRWFKAKKGFIKQTSIMLTDGLFEYSYPTDAYAIVDVVVPRRTDMSDILSLGFFDIVPAQFVASNTTFPSMQSAGTMRFDMGAYVQLLQSLEMRRRIFSGEPDWIDQPPPIRKILLTNRNPVGFSIQNTQLYMIVFYKTETMAIGDFVGRDEDLFYRYCLARAKLVLGTIRSKFSQYPAAGGAVTMDGDALKTEAYAEIALLEDEITESQGNAGGILQG